ncbi:MAG: PPC domain-containing protein [Chromatiales bacterium]|nr:PPC domain-containing protein [Chromatiales bacterium]
MIKKHQHLLNPFSFVILLAVMAVTGTTQAQDGGQNPTPIVITLTPSGGSTAVPTEEGALPPDRFEPNNDAQTATAVGLQNEPDLTLTGDDVDYFTGYLKAGQMIRVSTAVYGGLDTRLQLYWGGQLLAENDDRSPTDVGSLVTFTAPADGWYVTLVEKATVYDGTYDLEVALAGPTPTLTPTPTALPSATPTPTPSPTPVILPDLAEPNNSPETARPVTPGLRDTYTVGAGDVDYFTFIAKAGNRYVCETVTDQVDTLLTVVGVGVNDDRGVGRVDSNFAWTADVEQTAVIRVEARGGSYGQYEFVCQPAAPLPVAVQPPASSAPASDLSTPTAPLTTTAGITTTGQISLTVRHLGQVQPQTTTPTTHVRLLVYYDANNDRQPGPGEGIANVSVLAVDSQGQRLARVFTNAQGEAIFNLTSETIARVIVPFVPGWSARVRAGEINNDIVLGLPAVRLPVFLPVQNQTGGEE